MARSQFRIKEFGTHNPKVVFFFAGMATRTWFYTRPIKRMVANGYHVIAYDFRPLMVHLGDAESFLRVAADVMASVDQRIKVLKAEGVTDFTSFGFSMGTIMTILTATTFPEVKRTIIMLTYGSVAESVWTWWFIKPTKRRAIKQGYSMESLDTKLAAISPIPNAPKLKDKNILLYIAHKDKILPYEQASEFIKALDKAGVKYKLIENTRHGHNYSAIDNFRRSEWMDFLKS